MRKAKAVTVVVPVYGDWNSLKDCIESLIEYVDTEVHQVMLVNDSGPEADLLERSIKSSIKDRKGFEYHRNPKNLGFVRNCNRAVNELDKTNNDILLLNSDTEVTEGFLDEMIQVLYSSPKVGAVSPRSNNASIMTVPLSTAVHKGIGARKSHGIYKKIKRYLPRYGEVPVAHGFCMLIRRSLIKKYGLFDEVFGKGYGEEVDFCMRIAQHGYRCLVANHAYVFHMEARSFSLEAKSKLLETNNKIIWKRYPEYRELVREYMDGAVVMELEIEKRAGIESYNNQRTRLKSLVRRNKFASRVAVKVHRFLKKG